MPRVTWPYVFQRPTTSDVPTRLPRPARPPEAQRTRPGPGSVVLSAYDEAGRPGPEAFALHVYDGGQHLRHPQMASLPLPRP